MNKRFPRRRILCPLLLAPGLALVVQPALQGATVNLNASDALNSSSYNAALNWSSGAAPSAGNDYVTGAFGLRTPTTGSLTFAGGSLSLDAGGGLTLKGAGPWTINNLILNGGSIGHGSVGGAEIATINGSINVAASSTLNTGAAGRTILIGATLTGAGTLNALSVGLSALSGNSTGYTGAINVGDGTAVSVLEVRSNNGLGATSGITTVNGNGATGAGASLTINGTGLNVPEPVTLALNNGRASIQNNTGSNTLSGNVTLSGSGGSSQGGALYANAGTFTVSGNITGSHNNALFLRGGAAGVLSGDINVSGGMSLYKTDGSTWTIGAAGKTYSWGDTQVASGTLRMGVANVLPASTGLIIGQGDTSTVVLDLNGFSQTVGSLTSNLGASGTKQISSATAATLTINQSTTTTYAGQLGGTSANALALVKSGAGSLTLSAANTYANGTTVNGGTLVAANAAALGTGAVTVGAGNLQIANVAVTANNLTLNNGATLSGTGTGASFSKSNYPTVAAGAAVTLSAPGASDVLTIGTAMRGGNGSSVITVTGPGTVTLNSGATAADAYHGAWSVNSGTLIAADVNALGAPASGVTTGARPVTLAGGTLEARVLGGGTYGNAVTVTANSSINPNRTVASPGAGAAHAFGALSIGAQTLGVTSGANITSGTGEITFTGTTLTGNATFNVVNGTGATRLNPGAVGESGGTRSLTKSGTGTLLLAANNTYGGTTTINANGGVVQVGAGGSTGSLGGGAVSIGSGATLRLNRNDTFTLANNLSGAGTLYIGSTSATVETDYVNLTGSNAGFTGPVTVNMGGVRINDSNGLGTGTKTVTMTAGTAGNPHLRLNGGGGDITLPATISFQTSNNTNSGTIINEAGNNVVNGNFTMTAGGGNTWLNSLAGSMTFNGSFTPSSNDRYLRLSGAGNGAVNGNITPSTFSNMGVIKEGSGTWTLAGNNTFDASTTISAGVLRLGSATAIPNGTGKGSVVMNPASGTATLDINGFGETINGLTNSGAGSSIVDNTSATAATLTVGDGAASSTFNGVIQDTGGNLTLQKTGSGRLTLGGNNTFQGNILTPNVGSANHGQIRITSATALGTGPKVVRQQTTQSTGIATLELAGGFTTPSNIDLNSNGHGTANTSPHLDNVSGNNTWGGKYIIGGTGGSYFIRSSEAGSALTLAGGVNNGISSTRSIIFYGAGNGVISGPITQTGGGALTLEFGQTTGVNPGTWTISSTGNTYTGRTLVRKTDPLFGEPTLVIPTGNESSLGAPAAASNALELDGGVLQITTNSLTLNDPGRGLTVNTNGGKINVDAGLSFTFANTLGATGVLLTKQGGGTFNLTGTANVGQLTLQGGVTDISGGELRVNTLQLAGGSFVWGTGRLTVNSSVAAEGVSDFSSPGYAEVKVGKQFQASGGLTTASGSVLEAHGSPTLYLNNGLRFNAYDFAGTLDLQSGGDTLEVEISPYLLRPVSPTLNTAAEDFGSIPLVTADEILGAFDTFGTIYNDGRGFDQYTGVFTSAAALPINSWYLEYANTDEDLAVDTIFFHYRVNGYVPEPDTFAFVTVGTLALRLLRRVRFTGEDASVTEAPRKRRRRLNDKPLHVLKAPESSERF